MKAIFPGGTITGAPKYNVMKMISDIEHSPRGPYTGCLGYISSGYGIDFNILIRSLFRYNNTTQINTGAGIVIDSDPAKEWLEVNLKIASIKDILLGHKEKHIKRNKKIRLLKSNLKDGINIKHARVLFYENNDSFSFNIIALLKELGADLDIASTKHAMHDYSHIIIGPGPGNPKDMPHLSHIINEAMAKNIPLLGICLGHQAIGYTLGASIRKAIKAIHGETRPIYHHNQGLFLGLTSPLMHTRYHSLVIDHIPDSLIIDAYSDDDEIMAIRHKTKPLWGLQFHPESYLSNYGHDLLSNFLQNI
jgi:anthranilate synthase